MATSRDSEFAVEGPVLQATAKQVVFLGCSETTIGSCLIEWEISGPSLMRRWGPCPSSRPVAFVHSLYVDNKSMLEGLSGDAHLSYLVNGASVDGSVPNSDLAWVEAVVLSAGGRDSGGHWRGQVSTTARVGR